MDFKTAIINIKANTKLQKKQIARAIGITPYYLWKIEVGKAVASRKVIDRLLARFGSLCDPVSKHYKAMLNMKETELIRNFRRSSEAKKKAVLSFMDM